jgi:hypothetical protein
MELKENESKILKEKDSTAPKFFWDSSPEEKRLLMRCFLPNSIQPQLFLFPSDASFADLQTEIRKKFGSYEISCAIEGLIFFELETEEDWKELVRRVERTTVTIHLK